MHTPVDQKLVSLILFVSFTRTQFCWSLSARIPTSTCLSSGALVDLANPRPEPGALTSRAQHVAPKAGRGFQLTVKDEEVARSRRVVAPCEDEGQAGQAVGEVWRV